MKLLSAKIIPVLAALLCFSGCMSFDYVGQSFTPRSKSAPVNIIQGRDSIPAGAFRIIGRGTLTGPQDTDLYDRSARLREEARSRGADAVCIVSTSVRAAGVYPRSSDEFSAPLAPSANRDNLSPANTPWETDSFGQMKTLKSSDKVRYVFETKVIFLKKTADFNAEMKKRSSFL